MTMRDRAAAAALAAALAAPAAAFEWETLFEKGAWRVDLNILDDGALQCESFTGDGETILSILTWDDGEVGLRLRNEAWRFGSEGEEARYEIRIDRLAPWSIAAAKIGDVVLTIFPDDGDAPERFLREVYRGDVLVARSEAGREIARFSLAGSAAALIAHSECADRILGGASRDPFGASVSDPF